MARFACQARSRIPCSATVSLPAERTKTPNRGCLGHARADTVEVTPSPGAFVLLTGLGVGLLGAATATDVVSLRAVAHAVDVPMLSALVIGLREAMPTSLAHSLEPASALMGGLMAAAVLLRPGRYRAGLVAAPAHVGGV